MDQKTKETHNKANEFVSYIINTRNSNVKKDIIIKELWERRSGKSSALENILMYYMKNGVNEHIFYCAKQQISDEMKIKLEDFEPIIYKDEEDIINYTCGSNVLGIGTDVNIVRGANPTIILLDDFTEVPPEFEVTLELNTPKLLVVLSSVTEENKQ